MIVPTATQRFCGRTKVGKRTQVVDARFGARIRKDVMATLTDFEHLLPTLSRGEKAQILKWVVQDLGDDFPGIDSRPDVCGGEPCVVRTRIPVWLLEQARRLGTSEQQLLEAYPSLRAEDLVNAWAYVRSHPAEITGQIAVNESA